MDTQSRHLLTIGILANVFEWFEFTLFITLAPFIAQLFFTAGHPTVELIYTYSVFALSFVARPLGGILFGIIGNRISRSASLRLSLTLMSVPTVLIGLLPTYPTIGVSATIALVILRLIQGFAAGGELPMTACYVFESASDNNRSFLCSIIAISPKLGMLLASLVSFLLTQCMDNHSILNGGWRLPFLGSIPLTLFIIYLRRSIQDTPSNTQATPVSQSLSWEALISNMVKAMSLVSFGALWFYTTLVWIPTYLSYFLHTSPQVASITCMITLCSILPLYFFVQYPVKHFGYQRFMLTSISLMVFCVVPIFSGFQICTTWPAILLLQLILGILYVGFDGVLIESLGNLFPSQYRSIGLSLTWTLSAALVGGTAPLVCTASLHYTNWPLFPAYYLLSFGLVALLSALNICRSTDRLSSSKMISDT